MKVLVPLITRQEDDAAFLDSAAKGAEEVVLLLVVDAKEMFGKFGFASSGIMQGNELMKNIRIKIAEKSVKEAMEWGDTVEKIVQVSERENADKICLKTHDSLYWRELEEKIRCAAKCKVESF